MNAKQVQQELLSYADDRLQKRTLKMYPSLESYGVKMKDIRQIASSIGTDHALAKELFETNHYECMMIGALIFDSAVVHMDELQKWVEASASSNIIDQALSQKFLDIQGYFTLLQEWCNSSNEHLRYAGYALLSSYFRKEELKHIEFDVSSEILLRISKTISSEPLVIQNAMNNAVVMAGLHVPKLVKLATEVADQIGYILPLRAKNQCNIQSASDYLVRYLDNPKYSRVAKIKQKGEM